MPRPTARAITWSGDTLDARQKIEKAAGLLELRRFGQARELLVQARDHVDAALHFIDTEPPAPIDLAPPAEPKLWPFPIPNGSA